MALIQPTIGRKVWFYPQQEDLDEGVTIIGEGFYAQPLDATIVFVWGDSLINLHVLDHEGKAWKFEKVILLPDYRPEGFPIRCTTWPPHQLDQARKEAQKLQPSADIPSWAKVGGHAPAG